MVARCCVGVARGAADRHAPTKIKAFDVDVVASVVSEVLLTITAAVDSSVRTGASPAV